MATKAFKNEKIEAIKENIAKAKVAIVADYRGMTVEEITNLRRQVQEGKGDLQVVKNTLARKAVEGTAFAELADLLKGPAAIAYGFEDQVAPAKVLSKFIKDAKKGEIKGGVLDGRLLSVNEVKDLAQLPSKEELYAKILGSLNSPASGIVFSITGVMRALTIAMDGVRKQKESA